MCTFQEIDSTDSLGVKTFRRFLHYISLPVKAVARGKWPLMVIIFLVSFIIRALFIFETADIPSIRTPVPGMDIDLHWQAASMLMAGATRSEPFFELMMCSTPFHIYWLAFWRSIFGDSLIFHQVLNAFFASFNALLIFHTTFRLVGKKDVAAICGLAWATLPSLIYFESTLYKSGLELLSLNIVLWILLSGFERKGKIRIAVSGIIIGIILLLLLCLQLNTFLYPVLVVAFILFDKNIVFQGKVLFSMSAVIVLLSGSLYFHLHGQSAETKYSWFQPQKGVHIRIGFNENANGSYVRLKSIPSMPYGHLFYSRMYAETVVGNKLSQKESDWFYIRNAAKFISENPIQTFQLVIKKVALFINNHEVKGVDDLYYLKNQSRVLACSPLGLGVIEIFAGLGAVHLLSKKKCRFFFMLTGFLVSMLAGNIIIFVTWRYRLHCVIPLILMASYGIVFFKKKTLLLFRGGCFDKNNFMGYLWKVLLPMCLCGIVAFFPLIGDSSQRYYNKARINDGLSQKAEKLIQQLEQISQEASSSPRVLIQKATILNKLHRHSQAFRLLLNIHERGVGTPDATILYVRYLVWLGEYEDVSNVLKDAEKTSPGTIKKIESKLKGVERIVYRKFIKKLFFIKPNRFSENLS